MIRQGDDENDDGELQESEVDSSEVLCNGQDSPALVDSSPEPAGANCATGGTRVRTGVDKDHDGTLDDDEVQNVAYLCNTTPTPMLVSTANEPPGTNCPLGGVAVSSGMDLDNDGILDANEVTGTSFVCTGQVPTAEVVTGDFYLRNSFDQALLVGVKRITGTLYVQPTTALPEIVISNLEKVGRLYASQTFASLTLPRLEQTGLLEITATGPFPRFELPVLAEVTGAIRVATTLDAPSGFGLDLPALTTAGSIEIENSQLASLRAPQLAALGALELRSLSALQPTQVDLGDVAEVAGAVIVERLPWTSLEPLAGLRSTGSFSALQMEQLLELDLPVLETTGHLTISGCSMLLTLDGFERLTSAANISITSNTNLTSIEGFNHLETAASLGIGSNPQLLLLPGFFRLKTVTGMLSISITALTQLGAFPELVHAGAVNVSNNSQLVGLAGFSSLKSVDGTIELVGNPKLASINSFATLESAADVRIYTDQLRTLSAPQLSGDVDLYLYASLLTSVEFPQVTSGTVVIRAPLTTLSGLAGLRDATLDIDSRVLTTVELPRLESGFIRVLSGWAMTTIDVPALRSGALQLSDAQSLVTVHMPLVEELDELSISKADVLRSLEFPRLKRTAPFSISFTPLLERLEMPVLEEILATRLVYVSAPRLPKCHVTDLLARGGYPSPGDLQLPACVAIDRCVLQGPSTMTIASGASLDIVGRVHVSGITDMTSGIDGSVVMRFQVGRGPRGTPTTDGEWSWTDASPTASWNDADAVGFDEYRASIAFSSGSHDTAARFSGDGGRTWTTCDLNGSEDGYQVSNAGQVEAQ